MRGFRLIAVALLFAATAAFGHHDEMHYKGHGRHTDGNHRGFHQVWVHYTSNDDHTVQTFHNKWEVEGHVHEMTFEAHKSVEPNVYDIYMGGEFVGLGECHNVGLSEQEPNLHPKCKVEIETAEFSLTMWAHRSNNGKEVRRGGAISMNGKTVRFHEYLRGTRKCPKGCENCPTGEVRQGDQHQQNQNHQQGLIL